VLPQVATQVIDRADRSTTTGAPPAGIVVRDPSLASKVLPLINSALSGLRTEARSLQHAVASRGTEQIRQSHPA